MSTAEQLAAIREVVLEQLKVQFECYSKVIKPALAAEGVELLRWSQLTLQEQQTAREYFDKNLFPVLTPLAVDPGHPFPFISNLSTSLGVILRYPEDAEPFGVHVADPGEMHFARVKVPRILPRWLHLSEGEGGRCRMLSSRLPG